MADILRIFKRDMCGIFRNVLVLIIVIGLCVLPALYAWFNIYANWDPYGNTGNIAISLVIGLLLGRPFGRVNTAIEKVRKSQALSYNIIVKKAI